MYTVASVACANEDCKELSLTFRVSHASPLGNGQFQVGEVYGEWDLWPESSARPQPDFIPVALRDDYLEACRIRNLSPKASATLSRRCLQGMIRDFCGISRNTLDQEIRALQEDIDGGRAPAGVQADTMEAIDSVRKIGNIGAHMEKDINLIIDVDPAEAQLLIELIELLFEEWYVAREVRAQKIRRIKAIADDKAAQKAAAGGALPVPNPAKALFAPGG